MRAIDVLREHAVMMIQSHCLNESLVNYEEYWQGIDSRRACRRACIRCLFTVAQRRPDGREQHADKQPWGVGGDIAHPRRPPCDRGKRGWRCAGTATGTGAATCSATCSASASTDRAHTRAGRKPRIRQFEDCRCAASRTRARQFASPRFLPGLVLGDGPTGERVLQTRSVTPAANAARSRRSVPSRLESGCGGDDRATRQRVGQTRSGTSTAEPVQR